MISPDATPTVLLAEGNPGMRLTLTKALESEGYRVLDMADGEELLDELGESADEGEIDLVLAGMPLRGCPPMVLLERAAVRDPELPVVLMDWGDWEADLDDRCATASVLEHPFELEDLLDLVQDLLDERWPLEAPRT